MRPVPRTEGYRLPRILRARHCQAAAGCEVSGVLAEAVATAASTTASVFSACNAVSSTVATSASSKKPAAMATLMSLVTRSCKPAATDENRELATLEKMEQLHECRRMLMASMASRSVMVISEPSRLHSS